MKSSASQQSYRRLIYLCLQPTREGQASHAHVLEIIAGLEKRGWSVRLIEPPTPTPGRFDALRRAAHIVLAQVRFALEVARHRPDAAYVRLHFAALPASLLLRLLRVGTVQEVNGPLADAYDAWPWLRWFGRLVRFSAAHQLMWAQDVIVVTPELCPYVSNLGRLRHDPTVIGNGADPDRFHPQAAEREAAYDPYVVFVGALATWQGIGTLIDATRRDAWPPGVGLVIAGDGRDRRLVIGALPEGRVKWLGNVPYAEVPALISRAQAALVPKLASTGPFLGLSPVKLYEAMACAVPVVVTDVPGLADTVRQADCGVVVASGDALGVAQAVRDIVSGVIDGPALGRRGRDAVLGQYSWDVRAEATHALLERMLASTGTGTRHGA